VPVIWHVHDYVSRRRFMMRLLRWSSARCAAVVAISHSVAGDVRAVCGPNVRVYAVHNAIDPEQFCPTGPTLDLDALAGLPSARPGTVRVGLVATLARWKGHETYLRALALLPPTAGVRGYVIGGALYETDGSQYSVDELRELAARWGVPEVGFTGFVENAAAAMRALDIVVHASTQPEPFGLVIAEAMACGRPVIVSYAGGAAEIVEAGRNALTHAPGDAAALADHILRLAADPGLRSALGAAGRETARRRFHRARLAAELGPIYHAVTSRTA
jgi:glycosyltransferase involved in cell wall biosynthesis